LGASEGEPAEKNMERKKILYVITQGEWGGAQRYVFDLATNLGPEYDVTVAVGEPNGRKDLQDKIGRLSAKGGSASGGEDYKITVVQLKHLVRNISPIHDFLAIFELAKLYRTFKPNIIHLNSSKAGIIGSLARLCLLIPKSHFSIIYTAHGWVFDEPLGTFRHWLYRGLEKITAYLKDGVIVLSERDFDRGVRLGIAKIKLHIVRHGIKTNTPVAHESLTKYIPHLTAGVDGKQIFGIIANLYATKGIDVLIKAVHKGGERLKDTLFVIFGEGDERAALEKLIKDCGLERKIFLVGSVDNASQLLPSFDAFVLPSRKEGLPYVLLEAMQARVPIIATRVGGIPELIEDKKSGLLVKPDNVEELSEALVFAVEHPERIKEFANNAPTPPPLSAMIEQTTSLYRSLL
jgi:glycosyltransferase involved in cell wall biosynthesis